MACDKPKLVGVLVKKEPDVMTTSYTGKGYCQYIDADAACTWHAACRVYASIMIVSAARVAHLITAASHVHSLHVHSLHVHSLHVHSLTQYHEADGGDI